MFALRISLLMSKAQKPFTVVKEFILPAAKDICHELLGVAAFQKVACVPLSTSTITRQIYEIRKDIEAQLLGRRGKGLCNKEFNLPEGTERGSEQGNKDLSLTT